MKFSKSAIPAVCVVILLALASCSGSKKTVRVKPGPFAKTPIVVDGDDVDWPSPYPFYDSKALISYAACNDQDKLYLSVKANDRRMMMKLLRGGMKIWIDTSGGKDEYMCIQSPMAGAMPERSEDDVSKNRTMADSDPNQHGDPSGWRKKMLLGAEQFSIKGFGSCDGNYATTAEANSCGIQVKLGINDYNELVWEAAIPFSAWHHKVSQRDLGKPVNVCFEIGGVKMPERTHGGQGSGGHMGGGGSGMRGGGGMHGGGMRGAGGMGRGGSSGGKGNGQTAAEEREVITQTTQTWLKVAPALH